MQVYRDTSGGAVTTPDQPMPGYWAGLVCPYETPNANDDLLSTPPGEARTRDLPLPFLWQPVSAPGHDAAGETESLRDSHTPAVVTGPGYAGEGLSLVAAGDTVGHTPAVPCTACLVAAAAPIAAPEGWFHDPGFAEPTPMIVTDDGRVYGHAGLTGVSHRGYAGFGRAPVFAPRGARIDHLKAYRTAEGTDLAVMPIVMDTNHADTARGTTVAQVRDHYAHTGAEIAYVRAGEDRHGYWVAGSLLPGLSDEQMVQVRAMTLSGDWRGTDAGVEFIVPLAVPVPAIPVVRKTDHEGRILALVAAATPARRPTCQHAEGEHIRAMIRVELHAERELSARVAAGAAARARVWAGQADQVRARMSQGRG